MRVKKPTVDFLVDYDDQSILAELRRVAKATGGDTVTKADLKKLGRVSHSAIVRRFGSLRKGLSLAGLRTKRFMKASDEELLTIIIDLWQRVLETEGRRPQKDDLAKYGYQVSDDTITRRFGSWRRALIRAHDSITEDSVTSPEDSVTSDQGSAGVQDGLIEAAAAGKETSRRKRAAIPLRKRFFVFKRDHFACVRCGASGVGVRLEVHHRHPFARGGSDDLLNLETLCYDCNRGQSDSIV